MRESVISITQCIPIFPVQSVPTLMQDYNKSIAIDILMIGNTIVRIDVKRHRLKYEFYFYTFAFHLIKGVYYIYSTLCVLLLIFPSEVSYVSDMSQCAFCFRKHPRMKSTN